jgi:hypothetical protein
MRLQCTATSLQELELPSQRICLFSDSELFNLIMKIEFLFRWSIAP